MALHLGESGTLSGTEVQVANSIPQVDPSDVNEAAIEAYKQKKEDAAVLREDTVDAMETD